MTGRLIGEAYISLLADADMFGPDAKTKVDAALRPIRGTVPIDGDTGPLDKKVAAAAARMKGLKAVVPINADTRGFIRDISGLYVALETLKERAGDIPLDINDTGAKKSIFGVLGGIDAIIARLEKAEEKGLDFNLNRAIGQFYGLQQIIEDTEIKAEHMKADFDDTAAIAKLGALAGVVEKLAEQLANMRASVSTIAEEAQVAAMQKQALRLAETLADMKASVNTLPFEADLLALAAKAEAFEKRHVIVPVEIGTPLPSNPARIQAAFGKEPGFLNSAATLATFGASAAATAAVWERLNNDFRKTSAFAGVATAAIARLAAGNSMIMGTATGWGAWTNKIRLVGGALDGILPTWARAISMWHLGLDVLFEFAAAWVPAMIAVGVFAAYAFPVGEKIYGQWKNINTVIDGVGGKLPDLGRSFDTVQRAIEPGILIAFGEYMQVIGRNAGPMSQALAGVGGVVDKWGAALVNWAGKATASFDRTLHSGTSDFALIGAGIQAFIRIIGNLIHDMPGIVHVLLPLGDAILNVTANVIKSAGWFIKYGLLLHGVLIYAGLAATAVLALGRALTLAAVNTFFDKTGIALGNVGAEASGATGKFSKLGAAIGTFAGGVAAGFTNVGRYGAGLFKLGDDAEHVGLKARVAAAGSKLWGDALKLVTMVPIAGWAGLAAVAIGVGLYFAFRHTTTAAEQFQKQMDALVASSNAANIQQNLQVAFTKTTAAIQKTTAAYTTQAAITKGVQQNILHAAGASIPAYENAGNALNTYNATLHTTLTQAQNYAARINDLVPIFGSAAGAQAALNLAGIKAGDVAKETNDQWATQLTELKGLALGYGYMGQQVGAAGAQLNTLNLVSGTTFKNVQALQQAESQWISTITSGENSFTSFEQGQNTLNNTLKGTGASSQTLRVRIGNLSQTYSAVGAKMAGTSAASLAARQAFDQQLTSATTLWGNLQMLSVASGNTTKSQTALGKSGKDIIAQLLPFAAGSKQATAEVSALAQVMGGPATDNFQTLAKWVGHTKGAEADLNTQQANLTISASNLSVAAKNLGNALETGLANSEAAAIAKTFGLNQAIQGLASNVQQSGHVVNGTAVSMAGEYVSALHKAGEGTQQATQDLNAYLARLGYTPSQIKQIDAQLGDSAGQWNKYEAAVNNNAKATKNFQKDTATIGSTFKNMTINLGLGSVANNALWHAIVKQDAAMVANNGHATNAKKVFIELANNGLGVTTAQANALWSKFGKQNLDYLATHASNTKKSFVDFAVNGLHLTQSTAQSLWKMFAEQQLDMLVAKGDKAKSKFIDFAVNGLDLTKAKANDLWNTLAHQYLDTVATKAGETKQAFEKTASQFGLTKAQADNLWSSLHKLSAGSPYGVNVNETLTGSGKLMAKVAGNSVVIAASGANVTNGTLIDASRTVGHAAAGLGHHAAGGIISGGIHGIDSVPTMLAPGELVIPSTHAASHLVQAKREGIPGMAAGGFANWGDVANTAVQGVPTMRQGALEATANGMKDFAGVINSQLQQIQAQLYGVGGKYGGPTSFGGGFESLAALVAFARYFMSQGLNMAAAAGMAATISGEENSLGPESVGTGGFGLIGWTGNTIGLPPGYHGPTGNVAYDLQAQLAGVIGYMNSRGGRGPLNAAGGPVQAGDVWSTYEAPAVRYSDTRPAKAIEIYAALQGASAANIAQTQNIQARLGSGRHHFSGGMVNEPVYGVGMHTGMPYSFAERTPEYAGPLSGQPSNGGQQQPMTNIQGQQANTQLGMLIKLLQQMPFQLAKAMATSGGRGVQHGYYGAQA